MVIFEFLLIKTNSMIYICYIKYGANLACVLTVGDDELIGEIRGRGGSLRVTCMVVDLWFGFARNTVSRLRVVRAAGIWGGMCHEV